MGKKRNFESTDAEDTHPYSPIPKKPKNAVDPFEIDLNPRPKVTSYLPVNEILEFLNEGDLIEIRRNIYTHWAVFYRQSQNNDRIYYVIHLAAPDESGHEKSSSFPLFSGSSNDGVSAVVQCSNIMLVVGTSLCRVNNSKDSEYHSFEPHVIVNRALSELDKRKYNLLLTNCEHFVTWCRYGSKISVQSSMLKSTAVGTVAVLATGYSLAGFAAGGVFFLACKQANKFWNRIARGQEIPW